jgi:hypothetical protein
MTLTSICFLLSERTDAADDKAEAWAICIVTCGMNRCELDTRDVLGEVGDRGCGFVHLAL